MFYVYEWFIVDTFEVFYVGKGNGIRRFELHNRSKYFNNVYNKYNCAVRLVHQHLTNEEACKLEIERIAELKCIGQARCNFTSGGTGFSEGSLNPRYINPPIGKKNPMYGVRMTKEANHFYGNKHTEQTKQKISANRKGKGARYGKDNPMFGKGFKGKDNYMYGKTGIKHHNSKAYNITYKNGDIEILHAKACEKKFGIAFVRVRHTGGLLHYKKKSKNDIYEGAKVDIIGTCND
ncbi:NUMOD3 domain-containing DNA-binding protein [Chengkuizengella marina]|uniref:Nuclease associated modular domain-containing protein n=1 Tax=Chengkuizengella marina TaxID=2507566 RepID=A0A6N9Q824_9BACL|nr:NUMOD3 domain-containing DNA-binding protein [Chengkuizengella marina]NBI31002.1 hypothetical protein [Chengkuizengella marina]